jgi:ATP-binding cassette subfamily C protein
MINSIKASFSFMTPMERFVWAGLTSIRAFLSILDLVGVLAIGFVATSTAIFLTQGSDPNRIIEFAGLSIPAVNNQNMIWVAGAILILFLAKAFFSLLLTIKLALFVARVEARSAKRIAEVSFGGNLGSVRERSREEIMYAIQGGSPAAFNGLLNSASSLITESTLFVVICVGFFFVDTIATFAAIIYFGVLAVTIQFFVGSLMRRAGAINAESSIRANSAISDLIAVFRELLVLGKRNVYVDKIYSARMDAAKSQATIIYLNGMPRYIIEAALLVGVTIFVLAQAALGDIVSSAATIGVFLSGGFRLTASLLPLQNALLSISAATSIAKTAHDVLRQRDLTLKHNHSASKQPAEAHVDSKPIGVVFSNVSFKYPNSNSEAVHSANFRIDPGSQVALMGPSGAGKSTLADLLCLTLTPSSGSIVRTDSMGVALSDEFIGGVSYVPQRPGLVSGTIADNVALAETRTNINRARVLEAIELAHLSELVTELPEGIDTNLGKLHDGLSGGQIQRIGLARALYTKPGLLVMDEATSALDADSEAEIQKALEQMRGSVTVVLLAHRMNTIQHADQVILMEKGQVIDTGTFKALLSRNPVVARAVELMKVDEE